MKLKTEAPILGHDGDNVKGNDGKDFTFRTTICSALLANFPDENISGEEKIRRYELAKMIARHGEVELRTSDCVMIRMLVNKMYGPGVVGPVWEVIPEKVPDEPKAEQTKMPDGKRI